MRVIDTSEVHSPFRAIMARTFYEGWNFNSGNYLFTTDTK